MAAYRVQAERGGASSTTGVPGGELWDAIERGFSCDPRCAISVQLARGGEGPPRLLTARLRHRSRGVTVQ